MNMLKRYEAVEKVMPYNARKQVINLAPKVSFEKDVLTYNEEYFYKNEIKTRQVKRNLSTGKITKTNIKEETSEEKKEYDPEVSELLVSPNGKYALYSDHYNLVFKNLKTNEVKQVTSDGNIDYAYGDMYSIRPFETLYLKHAKGFNGIWANDNSQVIVNILVSKNLKTLTVTQVFNNEDTITPARPKDFVYRDPFPFETDSLMVNKLAVYNVKKNTLNILPFEPFYYEEFTGMSAIKWDEDNKGFIYATGDKHCKHKAVYHVDLKDATRKLLVEEATDTFFQENGVIGPINAKGGLGVHFLKKQPLAIWVSRPIDLTGLYFYNIETQKMENRITNEDINVAQLVSVDEENETIYFMANCLKQYSDPYFAGLCSIKFDGSDFKLLTKEDYSHKVTMSDDNYYYVDTYSTIDTPPVTVLRSVDDKVNEVLLKCDITRLLKAGYIMPKRTHITLDDGMDLYGCIVLPDNYDENKKYPVVDYCYGGPHTINTPKEFTAWGAIKGREAYGGLIGFAKLGFIGVIIDGRGTPHRGKKMHDISYRNLQGVDGLCDHKPFMEKLAKQYKGMDLTRVGIWGNSAGGYSSTRALLLYPDFFKVAVSSAGDHDNQIYSDSWALRYHGPWDKEAYLAQDSAQLVANFKGHLLLCHGLLDDNVNPSQTFRMIQYFNKANKDVDLMVLPDTDHNCPANVYFMRRRYDYFVRYLMGVNPPEQFKFSAQ